MYNIQAIPTTYAGVNFRSRLEARWAAFFDLVGWKWEYEPIDLPGWTPDFALKTPQGPLLVEVKPILWCSQQPDGFVDADMLARQVKNRADLSKTFASEKTLVLGCSPEAIVEGCFLGIEMSKGACSNFRIFRVDFSNRIDAICFYGTPAPISGRIDLSEASRFGSPTREIEWLWRKAGNEVQWKKYS